jgi:hypothetical protein
LQQPQRVSKQRQQKERSRSKQSRDLLGAKARAMDAEGEEQGEL